MKTKFFGIILAFFATPALADLTVYVDRPKDRLANAAKTFEAQTGEKVVFVEAPYKDLLAKLEADGVTSVADVMVVKDLVFLNDLSDKNLLQPMQQSKSIDHVAMSMRDPNLKWVALTYRARSVIYDPTRTNASEFSTYKDIADPKWRGSLCLRSGANAYNEALVSYLIENHGVNEAKAIVDGWIKNLAVAPLRNDNAVIEAVANGACDIGIVNHYYLAEAINKTPILSVKMAFLEQSGNGVHTNGAGVGILANSKKQALSQQFIEILLSDSVQLEFSAGSFEYPAMSHLKPNTLIKDWDSFKPASNNWGALGKWISEARKLMIEVGYN